MTVVPCGTNGLFSGGSTCRYGFVYENSEVVADALQGLMASILVQLGSFCVDQGDQQQFLQSLLEAGSLGFVSLVVIFNGFDLPWDKNHHEKPPPIWENIFGVTWIPSASIPKTQIQVFPRKTNMEPQNVVVWVDVTLLFHFGVLSGAVVEQGSLTYPKKIGPGERNDDSSTYQNLQPHRQDYKTSDSGTTLASECSSAGVDFWTYLIGAKDFFHWLIP